LLARESAFQALQLVGEIDLVAFAGVPHGRNRFNLLRYTVTDSAFKRGLPLQSVLGETLFEGLATIRCTLMFVAVDASPPSSRYVCGRPRDARCQLFCWRWRRCSLTAAALQIRVA
jgi:hypothetical protein